MRLSIIALPLTFLIVCNKNSKNAVYPSELAGKWKLTEQYISTGGPGEWHSVPANNIIFLEFKSTGEFLHSSNFPHADSLFDRYNFGNNKVTATSSLNNKTAIWPVHYLDNNKLEISLLMCFEGCAYRFISAE